MKEKFLSLTSSLGLFILFCGTFISAYSDVTFIHDPLYFKILNGLVSILVVTQILVLHSKLINEKEKKVQDSQYFKELSNELCKKIDNKIHNSISYHSRDLKSQIKYTKSYILDNLCRRVKENLGEQFPILKKDFIIELAFEIAKNSSQLPDWNSMKAKMDIEEYKKFLAQKLREKKKEDSQREGEKSSRENSAFWARKNAMIELINYEDPPERPEPYREGPCWGDDSHIWIDNTPTIEYHVKREAEKDEKIKKGYQEINIRHDETILRKEPADLSELDLDEYAESLKKEIKKNEELEQNKEIIKKEIDLGIHPF